MHRRANQTRRRQKFLSRHQCRRRVWRNSHLRPARGAVGSDAARTSVQKSTNYMVRGAAHERRHLRRGYQIWHQNGRRRHAARRHQCRRRVWRIWRGGRMWGTGLRASGAKFVRLRSTKMMGGQNPNASVSFWLPFVRNAIAP